MRLHLFLALALALVAACGIRVPELPKAPPLSAATPEPAAEDTRRVREAAEGRDAAEHRLQAAYEELAAATAARDSAQRREEQARKEAREAGLRRITGIVAATALLALFASVALTVFLPTGTKKWGMTGIAMSIAVLATATLVELSLRSLALIGGILATCGVAFLLWYLWRMVRVAREAAAHGDRLESALRTRVIADGDDVDDVLAAVKEESRLAQEACGVHKLLQAARGKRDPRKIIAPELVPDEVEG